MSTETTGLTHFILIKHFFPQSWGKTIASATELGQVPIIKKKKKKKKEEER